MYMVKSSYVLLVLYLSIIKSTVAPMKMCSDQDFKKKKIGTMFSYVLLVIFQFLVPLGITRQKQRKEVDLGRIVGVLRPRTL